MVLFLYTDSQCPGRFGSSTVAGRSMGDMFLGDLSGNSPTLSRLPLVHVGPLARLFSPQLQTRSGNKTNLECQSTSRLVPVLLLSLRVACHPATQTCFASLPLSRAFCLLHVLSQKTFSFLFRKQECEGKLQCGFRVGHTSVKTDKEKLNPSRISHA